MFKILNRKEKMKANNNNKSIWKEILPKKQWQGIYLLIVQENSNIKVLAKDINKTGM